MRFCQNCGKELLEGAKFCEFCGAKIEASEDKLDTDSVQEVKNVDATQKQPSFAEKTIIKIPKVNLFSKKIIGVVAAAVIVIVLSVVVFSNNGPNFKKLYKEYCTSTWAELGDDGSYLSLDTNPYDLEDNGMAYPAAYTAVEKINKKLKLPDSLLKDMGQTTGADGKQSEEFNNVTVSWKYHPDSGLEVVYRKR